MPTEQQAITRPPTWTHVTPESFNEMRHTWVHAWKFSGVITASEYGVLDALAFKVKAEEGVAFPSQDWLTKNVQIPVDFEMDASSNNMKPTKYRSFTLKTIKRAVKRLEEIGAITILKGSDRIRTKRGRLNEYWVRFDRGPSREPTSYFLRLLELVEGHQELGDVPMDVTPMSHQCPHERPHRVPIMSL